jgi:hypothetical protein
VCPVGLVSDDVKIRRKVDTEARQETGELKVGLGRGLDGAEG